MLFRSLQAKEILIEEGLVFLEGMNIRPSDINSLLEMRGVSQVNQSERLSQFLRRPGINLRDLLNIEAIRGCGYVDKVLNLGDPGLTNEIIEQIEIEIKYAGYIVQQGDQIQRFEKIESMSIPEDYDFQSVKSFSTEGRERLIKFKPSSVGQASRISGITAADISVLMVQLKR